MNGAALKHRGYLSAGILYILVGLPGLVLLVTGRLIETRNPYLLLSLLGIPVGALLIAFGSGKVARNSKSDVGVRVGYIGLGFILCMLGSLAGVKLGVEPLMTSVVFCGTASSYLALVTLVFLAVGAFSRRK